ncbi:MAG: site-specific integrase [Clostridia bacterium]|nr:site-specific integrase [Clostridia bacterium]MBP3801734.1 site-specific integrase [Clostridia bacterium]
MEKIYVQPKMSKINLNCMFFEISLSMKGGYYRARSSSLKTICIKKNDRPETLSKISYENAVNKLIPKIENYLEGTNKKIGKIFTTETGKVMYSVENVIYENPSNNLTNSNPINTLIAAFTKMIENISNNKVNQNNFQELTNLLDTTNYSDNNDNIEENNKQLITLKDFIIEWLQTLHERTQKPYEDENYLSPTTLESYSRYMWSNVFPYLEKHPEIDNVRTFSEKDVDEILNTTTCKDTQRIMLTSLRLVLAYAKEKGYIKSNPIANKKLKKKKQVKKGDTEYEFIEENQRPLWINCMIKEIGLKSNYHKETDASLAFLFALLHGTRPEETCGVRWIDLDFENDDFNVKNAYKNIPIYDKITMKRIGWETGDGPLKSPESYRHIPIDILIKQLLINHKKQQKNEFKKDGRKWSENQYVFLNSSRTPFTPKTLSKNFTKFVKRNNLPHMVLYGLRHSFATHCRNLGMSPEVLARLMGHTEFETTQKYYIHVSSKQKKDELQKIQYQDIKNYLGDENKNFIHLQNNINNKHIENLQQVQKADIEQYLQLNNDELKLLKIFIMQLQEKKIA